MIVYPSRLTGSLLPQSADHESQSRI